MTRQGLCLQKGYAGFHGPQGHDEPSRPSLQPRQVTAVCRTLSAGNEQEAHPAPKEPAGQRRGSAGPSPGTGRGPLALPTSPAPQDSAAGRGQPTVLPPSRSPGRALVKPVTARILVSLWGWRGPGSSFLRPRPGLAGRVGVTGVLVGDTTPGCSPRLRQNEPQQPRWAGRAQPAARDASVPVTLEHACLGAGPLHPCEGGGPRQGRPIHLLHSPQSQACGDGASGARSEDHKPPGLLSDSPMKAAALPWTPAATEQRRGRAKAPERSRLFPRRPRTLPGESLFPAQPRLAVPAARFPRPVLISWRGGGRVSRVSGRRPPWLGRQAWGLVPGGPAPGPPPHLPHEETP